TLARPADTRPSHEALRRLRAAVPAEAGLSPAVPAVLDRAQGARHRKGGGFGRLRRCPWGRPEPGAAPEADECRPPGPESRSLARGEPADEGVARAAPEADGMNACLDAAVAYAEAGWPVFPIWPIRDDGHCACAESKCENAGKHPVPTGW